MTYNVLQGDGSLAELGSQAMPGGMLITPLAGGRVIPTVYADQFIKFRVPWEMNGELLMEPNQNAQFFPEDQFKHAIDLPFEVWRVNINLSAFDDTQPTRLLLDPQPTTLGRRIRMRIQDTAKNQLLTKSPTLIDNLLSKDTGSWEWKVPYTVVQQEGFNVQCDSDAFPTYVVPLADAPAASQNAVVERVRVEVVFQGYLLVLAPASERAR